MNDSRPKFLTLPLIRLPLPGVVSILHRISGALLFLALPFLLWMLQCSLRSAETYAELTGALHHAWSKLFLLVVLWAFLHHFCAGLRFLVMDMDMFAGLKRARASSLGVLVASLGLTAVLGVWLW